MLASRLCLHTVGPFGQHATVATVASNGTVSGKVPNRGQTLAVFFPFSWSLLKLVATRNLHSPVLEVSESN